MADKEDRTYGWRESFPRYYKASRVLQSKVGTGALDEALLDKIQEYMDTYEADVDDLLRLHLDKLRELSAEIRGMHYDREEMLGDVTKNIMQLKAVGSMFGYKPIGELSSLLLHFLDTEQHLNDDALEIVDAHNRAVGVLLDAGKNGVPATVCLSLAEELRQACERYIAKYQAKKTAP